MKRLLCVLSLAWCGMAATPMPAEEPSSAALYEEVEVLRHLLRTKVSAGYTQACQAMGQVTNNVYMDFFPSMAWSPVNDHLADMKNRRLYAAAPKTAMHGQDPDQLLVWYLNSTGQGQPGAQVTPDLRTEGVYLRGQGMVFTITMPPWPQGQDIRYHAKTTQPSDWEKARRQVRGEGNDVEMVFHVYLGPNLKEVLLKTLAENGKHLQHLKDGENVTVVVVFRGAAPVQASPTLTQKPTSTSEDKPKPSTPPAKTPAAEEQASLLRSYSRLYELQTKQGQLDDARKTLEQLLKVLDEGSDRGEAAQKTRHELLRRALQFYLTLENPTPDELKRMRTITEEFTKQPVPPRTVLDVTLNPSSRPRLPARLIITVPKKALVLASDGKLDMAAFEKLVQVDEVNWTK